MFAFLSRSGDEIYYSLFKSPTQTEVFVRPVDGNSQPRPVPAPAGFKVAQDRTADGRYIVYGLLPAGTAAARVTSSIWLWRTDGAGGKGEAIHFSQNTEDEAAVVLSPNNRYAAYTSSASGRLEVYIRPFPEGRGRWQVSVNGGEAPAWSANGKELFYKEGNMLMRVSVVTSGTFAAAAPEPLFEHSALRLAEAPVARYAAAPDGQRFLTVESDRDRAIPVVRLIENWLSEFTRAAPKRGG
jgi:Tol biopolymer transport system component